jgi:hypothetical protein
MRAMDDPIMLLFYLYPFVIASAAAIIFDSVKRLPRENTGKKNGLMFGSMLIWIKTIPGLYVMHTSMTWPIDFYIGSMIWEIIAFPQMGVLFARVWNV